MNYGMIINFVFRAAISLKDIFRGRAIREKHLFSLQKQSNGRKG
jgi:hypothetical protein